MTNTSTSADSLDVIAELQEIRNRRAVFSCLQRIARGMDRFDKELFLSALHPDALMESHVWIGGPEESYEAGYTMHKASQKATQNYLINHTCEFDGDTAHCETYFFFVANNLDDTIWSTGGRYIDRLERREGVWKLAFRHGIFEWSAMLPPATSSLFDDAPGVHLNGVASRSKEDPSYRRPFTNLRPLPATPDVTNFTKPRY